MSLFSATLLPGIFLILVGTLLLVSNSVIVSSFKALPRSPVATIVFWGAGLVWFLYMVWNIAQADVMVFETSKPWVAIFAVLGIAAFYYVPEFLAVRGICVLVLLAAWELLQGAFGEYSHPLRLFMVTIVYIAVALSLWMAVQPYRARDFIQWLFAQFPRARALGGFLMLYGVLLAAIAFTY